MGVSNVRGLDYAMSFGESIILKHVLTEKHRFAEET
jgi:hypothetical protein